MHQSHLRCLLALGSAMLDKRVHADVFARDTRDRRTYVLFPYQHFSPAMAMIGASLDSTDEVMLALDAAEVGTWRCDIDNDIVELSEYSRRLMRAQTSSLLYPDFLLLLHADDREAVDLALHRGAARTEVHEVN